jgi:hypothetical protein
MPEPDAAPIEITCPRCGREATVAFYGPCPACRDELRATVAGEQRAREAEEFEPKMHVTPNAVALKE